MPQTSITDKPMQDLQITIHDLIYQGDAAFTLTVRVADLDEPLRTVSVQRYSGLEVDYVETAVKAAVHAWLYSTAPEVKRAADGAYRCARKHAEAHEGV